MLTDEAQGAGDAWVAGKPGGVAPDQYPGPCSIRDEQAVGGTGTGIRLLPLRQANSGSGKQGGGWFRDPCRGPQGSIGVTGHAA